MLERPRPDESGPLAPFWDGVHRDALVLPFCLGCGRSRWPPSDVCAACGESGREWREVRPSGRVITFAVSNRAFHPSMADEVPYVLCVIELVGGSRMLGRLWNRGTADGSVIGASAKPRFVDVGDQTKLVYWELTDSD